MKSLALINSCKLDDFKECDDTSTDILFTSQETLEKHNKLISSLSEKIFGVAVDESHCGE